MRFSHMWWWSDAWRRPSLSHTSRPIDPRGAREGPRRHTHLRGPFHGSPSVRTGGSYRSLQRILVPRSPQKIGPRGRDPPLRPSTPQGRSTPENPLKSPSRWPGSSRDPQRIAPAHPNPIGPVSLSSVSSRTRIRFLSNPKETGSGGRSSSWDEVFRGSSAQWPTTGSARSRPISAPQGEKQQLQARPSDREAKDEANGVRKGSWRRRGRRKEAPRTTRKGIRVGKAKRVVRPQLRPTRARGIGRLRQRTRFHPVGYAENDAVHDEETTNWRGLAQNRQWIKASHQDDSSGEVHLHPHVEHVSNCKDPSCYWKIQRCPGEPCLGRTAALDTRVTARTHKISLCRLSAHWGTFEG